jgi:hypothetical protein
MEDEENGRAMGQMGITDVQNIVGTNSAVQEIFPFFMERTSHSPKVTCGPYLDLFSQQS